MKKYSSLLNQLREFGLNPNHWELNDQGTNFKVSHLKDKHLSLIGEVDYKNKKPYWFNLEFMSF